MGFDISELKKLDAWYQNCASLPGYDENEAGAKMLGDLVKSKLQA